MCKLADKIKFCTCVDENINIEDLNHYWVLHRVNSNTEESMNEIIMGMPIFPDHLHPMFDINDKALLSTLNTNDAFDKKINTANGDVIEIVLCNNDNSTGLFRYTYKYNGSLWESDDADCFELSNNYKELKKGRIKEVNQLPHKN